MNSRRWGRAVRAWISGTTALAVGVLGLVAAEPAHAAVGTYFISGVAVDESGPVAGVTVSVGTTLADGTSVGGSATTGADGRFTISGLTSDRMWSSVRVPKGYLLYNSGYAFPQPTETFSWKIELDTASAITGRVLNNAGAPVAGVPVVARANEPNGYPSYRTQTDAAGTYRLTALPAGRYYIDFGAVGTYVESRYVDAAGDPEALNVFKETTAHDSVILARVTPTAPPSLPRDCRVGQTAAVDLGRWPEGVTPRVQWQNQWNNVSGEGIPEDIPGATSSTYLVPADALRHGNFLQVRVTASVPGMVDYEFESDCYIYKGIKPTLISPPTVSGNPKVGETVTVTPGVWSVEPTSTVYFWRADEQGLGPSSASRSLVIPGAAAGKGSLYVWEKPTFYGYNTPDPVRSESLGAVAAAGPLVATANPTIRGVLRYRGVMTINPGTWEQSGVTFTYRWLRDGVPFATGDRYAPLETDIGHRFTVEVTASKAGFAPTTLTTTRVTVKPAYAPTMYTTPVVHGTPQVGRILTATYGSWSDSRTTTTFQWLRDGEPIPGETSAAHQVNSADVGRTLSIRLIGTLSAHDAGVAESVPTGTVVKAAAPTATRAPAVSGTAIVGRTLTADPGLWSRSGLRFSYQWLRDGVAIPGATSSTYTLTGADWTHRTSVRVAATSASYATATATSAATPTATKGPAPVNSRVPSISGRTAVGSTLTGYNGTWDNPNATFTYQWLRNGEPIVGARAKTYALTTADRGSRISIRVTADARGYLSASAVSLRTAAIEAAFTGALAPVR